MATLIALIVSLFLLVSTIPAQSAVFNIPSGNVTALIAAINAANTNGEENTINLEPGTYTLTAIDNGVIDSNSNGLPVITGMVNINGNDAPSTVIERDPAAPLFRIFSIASGGKLSVNGVTVRRGGGFRTQLAGGFNNAGSLAVTRSIIEQIDCCDLGDATAIRNTGTLNLSQTLIRDNESLHGATILNSGTMTIASSSITFNRGDNPIIENSSSAEATIQDSTVSDNSGHNAAVTNEGTMTIINSTVANNLAFRDFPAGIENFGTLKVFNSTISGNRPELTHPDGPGGVFNRPGASLELENSILAGNLAGPGFGPDCLGLITSLGNNIIGDPTDCDINLLPSDLTGDPGLAAFTDDGSPGNGHFPFLEISPAINAGNNELCLSHPVLARFGSGEASSIGTGRFRDVNGDGFLDLVVQFRTQVPVSNAVTVLFRLVVRR
jgi:hypothetical protein